MSNKPRGTTSFIEAASGLNAGFLTTLIVHPLDLLKLRLQVDQGPSRRGESTRIIKRIVQDEGGLTALYRGLTSNVVGNCASWALYFMWYDMSKSMVKKLHGNTRTLSYYDYFMASGFAGVITAACTNPIWVIKTRMLSTSSQHVGAYTSTSNGIHRLLREEGILGFYKGFVPSLFGVVHGALQFMAYEEMKQARGRARYAEQRELSNKDFLLLSGTSKVFASTITYPYQVVRSRLQTYDASKRYRGLRDVMAQIWRREGFSGYYKGLGPNLLRIVPSSCITFLVYENTKWSLSGY